MDPFIEGQAWEDFHLRIIAVLGERLTPHVRPRYVVRVQQRVYVEHDPPEGPEPGRSIGPDLFLTGTGAAGASAPAPRPTPGGAVQTAVVQLPLPEEQREPFLTIRDRQSDEVVTVIEVLSPADKKRTADGRRQYLEEREALLRSRTHLVELDLLRGGERMPVVGELPPADYYALVARHQRRPSAEVHCWRLPQRLPVVPIPLVAPDPDVPVDLQEALDAVHERAGYDYALDYAREPRPRLADEAQRAFVREVLARRG